MTLNDICMKIAIVENGLAYGEIKFSYDNLMSAIKPGHPADILDDILCEIGNEIMLNAKADIEAGRIKDMLKNLMDFEKCFKVKELADPIRELSEYLKEHKEVVTNG